MQFCPHCLQPLALTSDARCVDCGAQVAMSGLRSVAEFEFVVEGVPVPQGSMRIVSGKNGRAGMIADNSKILYPWREKVNATVARAVPREYHEWDGPIGLDLVFTLPRPSSAPKTKVVACQTRPDLDKLVRAVGDSLCPKKGVLLIKEDSRIAEIGMLAKTYPSPLSTHPAALAQPGLRGRVRYLKVA